MICYLVIVNGALRDRPAVQGRSSAAIQLEQTKKSYLSFSNKLYPAWKEQVTLKKLDTLKSLQREKDEAEKRRLVRFQIISYLFNLNEFRNHYIT